MLASGDTKGVMVPAHTLHAQVSKGFKRRGHKFRVRSVIPVPRLRMGMYRS